MSSSLPTKTRSQVLGLYKSILQAHKRHLPYEMRHLGDTYVRQEFKLHKTVTDQAQLQPFFTAWEDYLSQILKTARVNESVQTGSLDSSAASTSFGKDLPADMELSQEQLDQLKKLKEEASGGGKAWRKILGMSPDHFGQNEESRRLCTRMSMYSTVWINPHGMSLFMW